MTGPATAALAAAHEQMIDLQTQHDAAIGRRDHTAASNLRAQITAASHQIEALTPPASAEQSQARHDAWLARQAEVLASVRMADGELLDAIDVAAEALARLVDVADDRTATIAAHLADPARPPGSSDFDRQQRLMIGRERLIEVAAGDLVVGLAASALGRCSGRPWGTVRVQGDSVRAGLRLPTRSTSEGTTAP